MIATEHVATGLLAVGIIHTFCVGTVRSVAARYDERTFVHRLLHLLGEVEIVFGLWAAILVLYMMVSRGSSDAVSYLNSLNFTEPVFVFVIMAAAATRPILELAQATIHTLAKVLPLPKQSAFLWTTLCVGPLLGSLITEPAAMTVTALLLKEAIFEKVQLTVRQKYTILGVLFVNISIGGVLTTFAAPPVLMVARHWDWTAAFMLEHFGWRAVIAIILNASLAVAVCTRALSAQPSVKPERSDRVPTALIAIHCIFLALIVLSAHHLIVFTGVFLFFLGLVSVTRDYQDPLKLKESLMVGFFLGGLVVLGGMQRWWLEPLLTSLNDSALFFGSTLLTAVTDNAALTYLGAQVPDLTDAMKYALVAGAVTGGGLTVIANAPNPAGYSILQTQFGVRGIAPLGLALAALLPTAVAVVLFWFV